MFNGALSAMYAKLKVTTFLLAASSSTTTLLNCKETVKTEKMNVDA